MQVLPNKGAFAVPLNVFPEFSHIYIRLSPNIKGVGDIKVNNILRARKSLIWGRRNEL